MFPRRCSLQEKEQRVRREKREGRRGEEAGGKPGGRIRSTLMLCGRGRTDQGKERVPVRQRLNRNLHNYLFFWE